MRDTHLTENKQNSLLENMDCTNTALRKAARRLSNLYDDALTPLGLKATQVSLLMEVRRLTEEYDGQAPSLQRLACKLSIQLSALTHALKPLIRDGLVVLKPDQEDRRTKRALLTTSGNEQLDKAVVYWAEANQRIECVMGCDNAATLRALANQVASDEFLTTYSQKLSTE